MAEIAIRPPREGDAEELLKRLRPQDRAEVDALFGPGNHRHALVESMRKSSAVWVGTVDGEVACIFGVSDLNGLLSPEGAPWLLGSPLVDANRRAFVRRNRPYIRRMLALFPLLINVVDARNTRSIAWLRHMGFTILPPAPVGVAGLPFHTFFMRD